MTGAVIEIRPEGLERLNVRIGRLLAGLNNPEPLLLQLAKAGEDQTHQRIVDAQRGPNGEIWPEWSARYRATRHRGQRKLDATGALINSITAFADRQTAGWGTNLKYAATHQFGDPSRNIPARPFLGVSDENLVEFLDITERWFDRMLGDSA